MVENLLRGVGTLLGPVEAFTNPARAPRRARWSARSSGPADPNDTPGVVDTLTGGQATALLIAYLVLVPAVIGWLVTRRDVA